MFTGIVTEVGEVISVNLDGDGARMSIRAPGTAAGIAVGDSVAVAGVCLTAVAVAPDGFSVEMVGETLDRTRLGGLTDGDRVNLEVPLAADGRFDGHIVQGHIDGVGSVALVEAAGEGSRLRIDLPQSIERYVVEKGSLAVEGVSLTVAALGPGWAEVALIPHTLEATTLDSLGVGDMVNLEVDVIAKYVERLLGERA
jgi:riboflavin synthase